MLTLLNLATGTRLSPAASQQRRSAAACKPRRPAAASLWARRSRRPETTCSAAQAPPASPLAGVQSEEQLFAILKGAVAAGKIPERLLAAMEDLYQNYKTAVLGSGVEGADEKYVAKVMAGVAQRSLEQLTHPYTFQSHHKRILEPYNYYEYGQAYVRGLVDFKHSVLGHAERFAAVEKQLAAGENVVILANHQTEADPAVWSLLLEASFPRLATDVIYVAGDRVVTDALCKPFSMGRNLFCVHSKKHLDDYPELKAEKQATNRRTLKAMQDALKEGGKLLWIAPSGGRDRRKHPETGDFLPDAFDPSAVELMRALLAKAKPQGHLYPMAMYSYNIMPPPASLEKALGEKRVTHHAAVGISLSPELDVDAILAGIPAEEKEARQKKLSDAAFQAVDSYYAELVAAIKDPASRSPAYTQPWLEKPPVPLTFPV